MIKCQSGHTILTSHMQLLQEIPYFTLMQQHFGSWIPCALYVKQQQQFKKILLKAVTPVCAFRILDRQNHESVHYDRSDMPSRN